MRPQDYTRLIQEEKELAQTFSYWRRRIFATLWVTYGAFYLCRVNISVALPKIMSEFGYSKTDVGAIGSALFIAYAVGQFINGQLGDKFGARNLITLGIVISAMLNIAFGFATTLMVMAIIWGANGYFQSMGWSPSVKTLANWFPPSNRGRVSGLYGSSFQIGNVVSWLLAGYLCLHYDWRYAFWVPACLFLLCGIQFYSRCRNSPEDIGLPPIEEYVRLRGARSVNETSKIISERGYPKHNRDKHLGFDFTLRQTIGNPRIWCVGLAYLFLSLMSFGLLFWAPTYMFEVRGITISKAALNAIILPLTGSLGALIAGWATDRFFKSRRAPIIVLMSILSGIFLLLYSKIPTESYLLSLFVLCVIGFTAFGAHTIMVTSIPMDYGTRKATASAAGFIDSLGYVGATITGFGTGWVVDRYGWYPAFSIWAVSTFVAAVLMSMQWKHRPAGGKYI